MSKKRVIVDYKSLPEHMLERLATLYPEGFDGHIIKYVNSQGAMVSAVPVETEDVSYLVKVSINLRQMVEDLELDEEELPLEDKSLEPELELDEE